MDYRPLGCSVHGILQAKILEWVAIPFSRGSSQPRDQTLVSCTAGRLCIMWATSEAQFTPKLFMKSFQLKRGKNVQNNHVCMSLHKSLEMEIFLKLGRRARDWIVQGKPWMWERKRASLLPSVGSSSFFKITFSSPLLPISPPLLYYFFSHSTDTDHLLTYYTVYWSHVFCGLSVFPS